MPEPTMHSAPAPTVEVPCTYCRRACSGNIRDDYGELMLRRPMPGCAACDRDLADEPGPLNEVR